MLTSVIKTKKGNFNVSFQFIEAKYVGFKVNASIVINSKTFVINDINTNYNNKLIATPEILKEFGIVTKNKVNLACDLSNVLRALKIAKKEKDSNVFDGKTIDSGHGFKMQNTKKNNDVCFEYGYDAIEKIK